MSATIPNSHKDLLTGPIYAILTTMMPDGQPQSTVVWATYDGEHVIVNTAKGRQKEKNMRANPKVSLVAIDTAQPFRWIEVRGVVEELTEQGAKDVIDQLARVYMGTPKYYGHVAPAEQEGKETRVTVKIKPTKVLATG